VKYFAATATLAAFIASSENWRAARGTERTLPHAPAKRHPRQVICPETVPFLVYGIAAHAPVMPT
jgi:hypothetical protein